jgi:hypothetical protein
LLAGWLGYRQFVVLPLAAKEKQKLAAESAADRSLKKLNEAKLAAADLDDWARLALPTDARLAKERYQLFLWDLLKKTGITSASISASSSARQPLKGGDLSVLGFTLEMDTDIWSLARLLHDFYQASRLQRVTKLTLTPVDRKDMGPSLRVSLSIQALGLREPSSTARRGESPLKPAVANDREAYAVLVERNMLYATEPGSSTLKSNDPEHVVLTSILWQGPEVEADLLDRARESTQRVRLGEEIVVGRVHALVLDLGLRDMVLVIDGNLYQWQLGTTFSSRTLLSAEEALDREVRNRRRLQNMN